VIYGALPRPLRFLTLDEVLTLHSAALDRFGGSAGVRDHGMLESALAMPEQGFGGEYAHAVPFGMATAYAFHLCKNHPFVDGNKRTALSACLVFLRMNGWDVLADENEAAERILGIAEGRLSKDDVAEWLISRAKARSSLELRDFFQALDPERLSAVFQAIRAGPVDERVATIMEAGAAIPAIHAANVGASAAEAAGDSQSALILRQHALLLTALYRVAEDEMGYEW
jgi:death-on-curing protein